MRAQRMLTARAASTNYRCTATISPAKNTAPRFKICVACLGPSTASRTTARRSTACRRASSSDVAVGSLTLFTRGGVELRADPRSHSHLQHVDRQGAAKQHCVVELPHVEAFTQRFLRFAAQCTQAQLADLVAERLTRPRDVALQFRLDVVRG